MMRATLRKWWPALKALIALVILVAVGAQFARLVDQPGLWERPWNLRPGWLTLAAGLYLAALACWGAVWYWLLRGHGEPVSRRGAIRAYFVSQPGKYVPGKAWTLFLRAGLVRREGVRPAGAVLLATYETLTTMAAGALIAVALLPWAIGGTSALGWSAVLLAVAGIPVLPGVFNRLTRRLARAFEKAGESVPQLGGRTLLGALARSSVGWLCVGTSLFVVVQAIRPDEAAPSAGLWLRCLGSMAAAYVVGFVVLPAPGGLGPREAVLQPLLARELAHGLDGPTAEAYAVVIALMLRAIWTAAEAIAAALLYFLPVPVRRPADAAPAPVNVVPPSCSPS
jgi:uncharacterized membrane protein YbhN (UPF0104 family)